ncbi:MAG TPA: stalk domain-containing protein [Armatimonadaceae bacterium]|nr:stalk domain-containing protein [Armatimonadaceae bacterium]
MRHWKSGGGAALAASAALTIGTVAAVTNASSAALAQGSRITVLVNGDAVNFTGQGPVEQGGRVLVPLRGVLERLGAYVAYDAQTRQVSAVRNQTQIMLPIGGRTARVNDQPVALDAPAQVLNGSTMVPLRFVAEALGAGVDWQANSRTVVINNDGTGGGGGTTTPRPTLPGAGNPSGGTVRGALTGLNVSSRQLTVREANGGVRSVGFAPNIQARRSLNAGGYQPIQLNQLRIGDEIEVDLNNNGRVRRVTVVGDGGGGGAGSAANTATGAFRRISRETPSTYTIEFENAETVDVRQDAPVYLAGRRLDERTILPGDRITVRLDPQTRIGQRIDIRVRRPR